MAIFATTKILLFLFYLRLNQTDGEIESSGQKRRYLLYVPESYDPRIPTPLVISLHGFVEWPAHQMEISGWNNLADDYGFIVVYPSGTGLPLRWHICGFPGSPEEPMADVNFISDLIDKLANEFNIDSSRIYANGLSNGGGMAFWLASKIPERITAVGSVAGAYLFSADSGSSSRSVPAIAFHGTEDAIVPYNGRKWLHCYPSFPSIPNWIEMWAKRNGCQPDPLKLPANGKVAVIKYTCCDQKADVIFYTIRGGGHSWPGGKVLPEFIVGNTSQDIDATRVMWDFFRQYSLDLKY